MKYTLLLIATGIISIASYSQQSEIADWQKKHPHILFVEQSDYTPEFKTQLESLNREVIVYNDEITMGLINNYASQNQAKSNIYSAERIEDATTIKIWLSENQDLKIVARSVFNELPAVDQNLLIEHGALILEGEKITLQDIETYEATH